MSPISSAVSTESKVDVSAIITDLFQNGDFDKGKQLVEHSKRVSHEDVRKGFAKSSAAVKRVHDDEYISLPDKTPRRLRSLSPPLNYGAVIPGSIYRSSYPLPENFGFLESLKIKSVLTLVPEKVPEANVKWMQKQGIRHFQVHIPANKDGIQIRQCSMTEALGVVLDKSNHPLLIHCNKGKHRTGCVVGCFRKCQGESSESISAEYHAYADPKARVLDECFIELFDERTVMWLARLNGFAPKDDPIADSPVSLPVVVKRQKTGV